MVWRSIYIAGTIKVDVRGFLNHLAGLEQSEILLPLQDATFFAHNCDYYYYYYYYGELQRIGCRTTAKKNGDVVH